MIKDLKQMLRYWYEVKKARTFLFSNKYYSSLEEIPLLNWWKCSEGDYTYLWKERNMYVPFFFKRIFEDMYFEFENIDLTELRWSVEANYWHNKWLTTKDIKHKRRYDSKLAEISLLTKKEAAPRKMNDLIKFVQTSVNWPIDATKITAGYFFSLYNDLTTKNLTHGNN